MNLMTMGRAGLLALAALATSGCSTQYATTDCPPFCGGERLTYPMARALDFVDMFELNMGVGQGLHAAAEIAPFRIGYGFTETYRGGVMNRAAGSWKESRKEFWLLQNFLCWEKDPCCGNTYLFDPCTQTTHSAYRDVAEEHPLARWEAWDWTTRFEDEEKDWLDFGFEATLGFLAVDAYVSPRETADFLLGIFMVDTVSHDDYRANPKPVDTWADADHKPY